MKVYRHGDVNLVKVSAKDYQGACGRGQKLLPTTSHVLAKGEATGSVHLLEVAAPDDMELVQEGDTLWLKLTSAGRLTHTSDHEPLTIEPGTYRQVPEREMDWFANAVRRVVD